MYSKSLRSALTGALLAAGLCVLAQATPAAQSASFAGTGLQAVPSHIRAQIAARASARRASNSQQTAGTLDKLPPTLTAFDALALVDVGVPGSALSVSFKATDDLSGVGWVYAWAYGPSGQMVNVSFAEFVPLTKFGGKMHSNGIPAFLEPGVYTFIGAYIEDFAGNGQNIDGATLATLGKVSFTVKNKKGFDTTPPTLVSGKIVTPRVDLSIPHAGTEYDPAFVQVAVSATDAGNSAVSGVQYASAVFCTIDISACISTVSNSSETDPLASSANLRLGTRVSQDMNQPGDYVLQSVMVVDFAGNSKSWYSTVFGGQTDFSTYFPSTTIKLVP